jgi:hypothetical protein
MFGSKRRKLLESGTEAWAAVTAVRESNLTREFTPNMILTLHVTPERTAGFDTEVVVSVPRTAIPEVGAKYMVRFDPEDHSQLTIDDRESPDKAPEDWTSGTGGVVEISKVYVEAAMVACTITADIFLVDRTTPYRTTIQTNTREARAAKVREDTILTVRANPADRSQVAISWNEEPTIVTITDEEWIGPSERALSEGQECQVVIDWYSRRWLKNPRGDELYYAQVKVNGEPFDRDVILTLPDHDWKDMLTVGAPLPGKCVPTESRAVAIDWPRYRDQAARGVTGPPAAGTEVHPQIVRATPPGESAVAPTLMGNPFGATAAPAAAEDPLDKLSKLADLHARGALTDAEFATEKAKILGAG